MIFGAHGLEGGGLLDEMTMQFILRGVLARGELPFDLKLTLSWLDARCLGGDGLDIVDEDVGLDISGLEVNGSA